MSAAETLDEEAGLRPQRLDLREETLNRTIWSLAGPAILGSLLFSVVFLADTVIVGWLKDPNALAAVALVSVTMWMINAPFHALSQSAVSLVSRCWGERDFAGARRYAGHALGLSFALSILIVVVIWPSAKEIVQLLGGQSEVLALGTAYLRAISLSALLGLPMIVATGAIRGTGDTKTPMFLTGAMNVVNVATSVPLAFGLMGLPRLGLVGVAWGTVIARSFGGVLSLIVLVYAKRGVRLSVSHLVRFDRLSAERVTVLALPAVAERSLNSIAHLIFIRIVAVLGTTALAAHHIGVMAESLAFMPVLGMGQAAATVAGQAIGARRSHIAELTVRRALLWMGMSMGALGVLFVALAPWAVAVFGATPGVLRLAGVVLQISAIELPFLAFGIILGGALRAAGDTKSPFYVTFVGIFVFRLGLVYLLVIVFGLGLPYVWLATALDWAARSAGLWWFFRRGAWKLIHEQEKARYAA